MTREGNPGDTAARSSDGTARRSYDSPRILFREPLETLAAVCQPAPPSKGSPLACPIGPVSS